jgi:hypothetical protein
MGVGMSDTNLNKMKAMQERLAKRGRGKYSPAANARSEPKRGAGEVGSAPAPSEKAPGPDAGEIGEAKQESSSDD